MSMKQIQYLRGVSNGSTKKKNIEIKKGNAQVALESKNARRGNMFSLWSAGHATQSMPGLWLL